MVAKTGIVPFWKGYDRKAVLRFAQVAEDLGYDSIWIPEAWAYDQFSLLTEIATATKRLKLATGIANVFSRSPGLLAMAAATLDEISEGRVILVVCFSLLCALATMVLTRTPDPASLVAFYRRVRPVGAWGPVRALCPDVEPPRELGTCLAGSAGAAALVFGLMFAPAYYLFERWGAFTLSLLCAGLVTWAVARALARLAPKHSFPAEDP